MCINKKGEGLFQKIIGEGFLEVQTQSFHRPFTSHFDSKGTPFLYSLDAKCTSFITCPQKGYLQYLLFFYLNSLLQKLSTRCPKVIKSYAQNFLKVAQKLLKKSKSCSKILRLLFVFTPGKRKCLLLANYPTKRTFFHCSLPSICIK